MRSEFTQWLMDQKYSEAMQTAQLHRVKKVEENYGDLDEHISRGTYDEVIENLQYSAADERAAKPNMSKIKFNGNIRNNLQSYKSAAVRYKKFLDEFQAGAIHGRDNSLRETEPNDQILQQKFSLERDMQLALRRNIASLGPSFKIIDDGAERAVDSGLIDITCEDHDSLVIVELKAGKADSRAIGQILGYMGDLQEEESGRPVRGILIAHDFDKRAKSAARVVPALSLKRYAIEFKFFPEE